MQSTDISNALEKAVDHLDNSEKDDPTIKVFNERPFALRMRMYKYIKAFKEQMKDKPEVDATQFDHLVIASDEEKITITSTLDRIPLVLQTEEGKEL